MASRAKGWDAGSILEAARAFQECRILLTGVELDLFTRLEGASRTAAEVARDLGADERATAMVLDALAAMGLLAKSRGAYRTAPAARELLCERSGRSVLPMARHLANLWKIWDELTEVVRKGGPAPTRRSSGAWSEAELRSFICAMRVAAAPQAPAIVRAVRPGRARRLLDVGGGPAAYTIAFLQACPGLRATLFDLPPVVEIAREEIARAGLLDRVDFVPGDFTKDSLPAGHDLAFLSAIIHQMSLEECTALYTKIHSALAPGGRLVVRDHVMDPTRTRPRAGAVFAINMLVATEGGGTYTLAEIRGGLVRAGFRDVRLVQSGEWMDSLVSARRP